MAFGQRPTTTFGTRTAFGAGAAGTATGGFQRTGTGFGQQANTGTFAQPGANRFGQGAAPTGFGQNRPTTGFGQGAQLGGQAAGFGGQQPQQQGGAPNYHPTQYSEALATGESKGELRAISGMDAYKEYSFEQLRWLNMTDPTSIPAQQAAGTGFGQRATTGGFGQQTQATTGGFGQRTGFGQQAQPAAATTGGFGQQRTGFGQPAAQQTATTGFGQQQRPAFGQQQATATTGFGAQRPATGFGTQAKAVGFGQQQTATTSFTGGGTGFGAQQPVFQQQQGTGFGAQKTGFGGAATTGFGNNGLRTATGVNRDGTTGAAGAGLARPGFGTGATATGFGGQQPAATGFGATGGGFQRQTYGAPQQAVNEPVYYTSISTAPFGILPQILKDTAAPKQPTEAPKAASAPVTMSASKRKHAMLPHYKLTPRSESAASRITRSLGADPEATGRDMFVSKMGGVKKLVIEPTDTEQSALFNPAERARLRAGIATGTPSMTSPASLGTYPSTPSAHGHPVATSVFTSPNIYATPSFPRGAAGIYDSLGSHPNGTMAGHPMSIVASPATGGFAMVGGPTGGLATNTTGTLPGANVSVNSLAPKLTIPGCFTIPSISDLRLKSAAELSRLPEFTIGHSTYGMVTWKTPTDVRNLNLDHLVAFSQDCVDVYPESNFPQGSPADGVLNKPATVTIFQVSVHRLLGREGKSPARHQQQALSSSELDQVIAELQSITSAFQGRFVSFVPEGNKWVFEVDHFTRYGLNGSNAVNPPTNAASTAQSSPNHSPTRRGRGGVSYSRAPSAGKTSNPLPSSNAPSAFKTLHIENDDDSDDSESVESVQPLLPSRSDVRPKRSASSGSSNAPASLLSAEDDDAGYEDDDEDDDATSAAPLSHRSLLDQDAQSDQATEVHSIVDDLSLSGDEEDEEEEYGDDDSHFYDSDFSRSDSASAHPQGGRSQQTRKMGRGAWEGNAMDETSSHRSFASSRASRTGKSAHLNSHDRASNAVDDIGRDGSESRHSRLFPHSTTHGSFDALSSARSPHLARQLGLNARHMQQMKAGFFPSSSASAAPHRTLPAPNFSTAKRQELFDEAMSPANVPVTFKATTSFTPGWDSHAAKRFKSSNPTLSEVKMQAPVSGGQTMRVLRIPPPVSQPAPQSPATSARLIAPLAKVSESIIKPVPLSNSVTKNASELFVDPMLFFGRSSRVCWSPDGSTMFCPKFTTIEKKTLFVAPTSVSESLVPSLFAHSRLSVFPHNRKTNALPSLTLGDNWNSFVNHQLAIVATQRQECQNLIGEANSGSGTDGKSKSLLNEAYLKLDTELNAWKMFKTLFGDVQTQFAEILNRFNAPNTIDHVKELVRKHQLDTLLCEMTIDQVKADLVEVSKRYASATATSVASNELHWKVLFYLLSGKCIKEAVDLALEMGEHRLALLLTQLADSTNLTSDMKSQLQSWSKEGLMGPNNVDNYKLEIYSILAGEIRVVASEHRISDWIRSFALFFWYSGPNPFAQPLKSTIDLYTSLITSPKSATNESESQKSDSLSLRPPQPLPGYARHLPSLKTVHYDIVYHLLSMYGESDYPLDDLLHPLSSSPRILDHALAWHLLTVCEAANLGDAPSQVSTEITLNFATQLEALGLWQIAYYVLLALPTSSQGEKLRNHAVKQLLFRHVSSLQGTLTGEASNLRIDDEKLARVLDFSAQPAYLQATHLQNIHPWIYEALALWFGSKGDFVQQFFMLLAHCQYTEAHNVLLNKWAPKIILDIGVADTSAWPKNFVDGLIHLEAASADHIINWTYGGNIFLSFYRWQNEVHSALKSWQTKSNDLVDLSLLAQLNLDSSSFVALVNEYTSALQGLHKLLQHTEAENVRTEIEASSIKTSWSNIAELQGPAGLSMKQRSGMTATSVKTELVCASELVSQLTASIASLKTLIACIDSDAAFPSAIAAHTVPLSSLETLDSLEPLAHTFLPPDDLSANLSLLTSRYLDWRVSAV